MRTMFGEHQLVFNSGATNAITLHYVDLRNNEIPQRNKET